ncbi:MAG TPA: DUF1990 domain-containing protein [Acidimicrobiales bacterium]|nr:DUF1990 domain-containing protein [Acidimicrobiales bacterium]
MFLIRPPSDAKLSQILAAVGDARFTYDAVGATASAGALPDGYHHVRATRVLGRGEDVFAAAVDGIRRWQLHRRQGYRVAPDEPPIEVGTVVAVDVPLVAVHVVAACRIAWVVDEPDRFGFGYGTLPIHPESGEEAFVVERETGEIDGDRGDVRLAIAAFSRPRHALVRLAGPVARRQQARATEGYLDALAAHVREVLG